MDLFLIISQWKQRINNLVNSVSFSTNWLKIFSTS